jgi:hypothetical protein
MTDFGAESARRSAVACARMTPSTPLQSARTIAICMVRTSIGSSRRRLTICQIIEQIGARDGSARFQNRLEISHMQSL